MARLIDADKLKSDYDITNWSKPHGCSFKVIDSQPTVDAESVRRGKWVEAHHGSCVRCTICETAFIDDHEAWPYCPVCGAKMEEESENG